MQVKPALEAYLYSHPAIDWDDMARCALQSQEIFGRVLADKAAFGELFRAALDDPERQRLHESDEIRTRFVLFDHPSGNFRLRLHFWQDNPPNIIHMHRFDYAACVLRGGYLHTVYVPDKQIRLGDSPLELERAVAGIQSIYSHHVSEGDSYCQSHRHILSSTDPAPGTVSMFLAGPKRTQRAFQWDPDTGTVVWKRGAKELTSEELAQIRLPLKDADAFMSRLLEYRLIQ